MDTVTEWVRVSGGANLATDVTVPDCGAYPVVIVRTVYGRKNLKSISDLLVGHGYATVVQDVRGSGESSGQFSALAQEPADSMETAQWVLSQPWCNGQLAILGISYLSAASIAMAAEFPEQVKAAIWVTVPVRQDLLCFQGGALRLHHTLPWAYMRHASLSQFDPALYRTIPLLEAIPQSRDPLWAAILEEGPRSRLWKQNNLWSYVQRTRVPGIHFGGWFDFLLDATLVPYLEMTKSGAPQRLVLGPWSHNGIIGGSEKISGDVSYGYWASQGLPEETVDTSSPFAEECIRWLDFWVKGTGHLDMESSVRSFFTGHEPGWVEFDAWPHPSSRAMRMYLGAKSPRDDCGCSGLDSRGTGVLSTDIALSENGSDGCESFVYDPENPVPTEGGAVWVFPKAGMIPGPSISSAHLRKDVLVYDSGVLESSLEICGAPEVELYASSDAPDTDFVTMLLDVDERGVARYVSDGIVRARYRNGLDEEELLEPGKIYFFRIQMKGCAHSFGPGHRVRLIVTSSNFPKFDRNPNTNESIYHARQMQKAVQTVYCEPAFPSAIVLPRLS